MKTLRHPSCALGVSASRFSFPRFLFAFLALCAVWLSPGTARANIRGWLGASGSNVFGTAGNWVGNNIPGASGDNVLFAVPNSSMSAYLNSPLSVAVYGAQGGIVFSGSAYSGSTGYTLSGTGVNTLTLTAGTFLEIDSNFTGSNITETVSAPVILSGASYFVNDTGLTSVLSVSTMSNAAGYVNAGGVSSGTNNFLAVTGSISRTAAGTLYLLGPGGGSLSGNIIGGNAAATAMPIYVDSFGTWTLSGSNYFDPAGASTTQVVGGTLALDFTTVSASNSKINPVQPLILGGLVSGNPTGGNQGGTLNIIGNAAGGTVQAVRGLNLTPGDNRINVAAGSGTTVLQVGGLIGRSNGASIDFTLNSGTQNATNGVQILAPDTSYSGNTSIFAGYATVNQTDWAVSNAPASTTNVPYNSGSNVVALGGLTNGQPVYFPNAPGALGTNQSYYAVNVTGSTFQVASTPTGTPIAITGTATCTVTYQPGAIYALPAASYTNDTWAAANNTTVTGGTTVNAGATNSLRFNSSGASATVNLIGSNAINSGGILMTPNVVNPMAITGGTLTSNGNNYSILQYSSAPLTISSVFGTTNQALLKSGAGTLILSASNSFNGGAYLNAGTTKLANPYALSGAAPGTQNSLYLGGNAVLDLAGNSIAVNNIQGDTTGNAGLNGSLAAKAGLTANITNSAPGTLSTLTIGNVLTHQGNLYYYGGFTEAPGAIISLNIVGMGQGWSDQGAVGGQGFGSQSSYGNQPLNNDAVYNPISITGGVTVGKGANLWVTGANFNMLGAFNLNGTIFDISKGVAFATTYLTGNGALNAGGGGSIPFGINALGSLPDVANIKWGGTTVAAQMITESPDFNGTGTVSLSQQIFAGTGGFDFHLGSTGTLIVPGIPAVAFGQNRSMLVSGQGTLKLTGAAGSILPGQGIKLYGGTTWIAPTGSGQNVNVTGLFTNTSPNASAITIGGGGTTLLLDKGANSSLTLTFGDMSAAIGSASAILINRGSDYGTLTIASAQGLSALGSATGTRLNLMSYSPVAAFPVQTNGISPVWMVGQDASTGSTKNATFLSYNYTGQNGTTSDTGFVPYTFKASNINNINAATTSSVELINSGTQTLTGWNSPYALEIDNATLDVASWNVTPQGLILNGGTINGLSSSQGLRFQVGEIPVYTSLAGGVINAPISQLTSGFLTKFGPGILTLTGPAFSWLAASGIEINAGVVDVGNISTGILGSAQVRLRGGVLQGNGSFTKSLGSSSLNFSITDAASGGGFSARGGSLTVTIGGATPTNLIWGAGFNANNNPVSPSNFLCEGAVLNFGSTNSDSVVNFTNNIDMGILQPDGNFASIPYSRVVSVAAATADAGRDPQSVPDYAVLSGTISSTSPYHGLAKDGNGVLVLSGSNTYTGATSIANGSLLITADANLGIAPSAAYPLSTTAGFNGGTITPGAVVINGGAAFGLSGTAAGGALTLNGNRTILLASGSGTTPSNISVYAGSTMTVSSLIGDYIGEIGNLGKIGGGTLILSATAANPFSGGVTIANGTVQDASANNANVFGAGNVAFGTSNTPTLDLNGHNVTVGLLSGAGSNGVITTTSNAVITLTLAGSGSQSYAGAINNGSGTVALTLNGGTQILTGANGFTGTVTLNGGTLQATNAALNASDLTNGIVFNGGALRAGAGGISTGKAVTMTGAGTFDTNGNNSTLSGSITGAGGLTKAGNGTLVLSSALNSFSGGLTVNSGTVQAGNAATTVLGSGNVSFGTSNTPTVDLNGNSETVGLLSGLGSNGVVTSSQSGAVTLSLTGSGTQVFGGNVKNGAGQVNLTVNSGAQILNGVNTYSGLTTVNGGSLTVTGTGVLPNTSGLTLGGGANAAFNFVTGTTGQILTLQNLTLAFGGTTSIGVEPGNTINVVNMPTGPTGTIRINVFGIPGVNMDPTGGSPGTPYDLLTAPSNLDGFNYAVGNVYGATNFTVGAPASNFEGTGNGNIVSATITYLAPITTAYWKGGFAGGNNVWAISDGSTASNWTTSLGSGPTSLVPGATANVTITGTGGAGQEGNMTLGANMAVNSLTVSDTNAVLLQDAINTLTVSGTKGIAVNAGSGTVNLNVGLVLNGTAAQALTANNATGLLISGPINSGTGGILVNGTNVLTLSGNNSFAGPVNMTAGTAVLSGNNSFGGALTVGNATMTLSGSSSIFGQMTLNSGGVLNAAAIGTDNTNGITFNGGTLQSLGTGFNSAKSITMSAAGTINTNGTNWSITGPIGGAGTLTKTGLGTLTLCGSNSSFTGGLTITNGTLQIAPNTSGTLTGGAFAFTNQNAPILDVNDTNVIVGSFTDNSANNAFITNNALDSGTGTLSIPVLAGGTTTLTASLQDGNTAKVGLVKTGKGLLQLGGFADSFTGGIALVDGTLQGLTSSNRKATMGNGIITFGTAAGTTPTFDVNGANGGISSGLVSGGTNAIILASASVTWTIAGPGVGTFAGAINQGANVLTMVMDVNAGSLTLTGSSNQTGAITINGGLLNVTNTSLNLANTTSGITFGGNSGGGILQAGSGGITIAKAVTVTGLGDLDTPAGNNITLTGVLGGAGSLMKTGSGTLYINSTTSTFTGIWDLVGGILNTNTNGLKAADTTFGMIFTGGTLQAASPGLPTIAKAISLPSANAAGTIDTNGLGTMTLNGIISGPGTLVKNGTDTMILTAANTFSGGLTINQGSMVQDGGANAGVFGAGVVTLGAAGNPLLDLNGHSVSIGMLSGGTNGNVSSNASGNLVLTLLGTGVGSGSQTYAGLIQTGTATSLGLTMSGTGTQILSGSNTYAGVTTINGGILSTNLLANGGVASGIGQSGNAATNLVLSGGILQYTGTGASIDRLFSMGGGSLVSGIDASGSAPLVFVNTGTMAYSTSGASVLNLTGSNTGANTLAAAIINNTGNTALVKSGPGTWVLTGNNTFTGGIQITGGVLGVQGTSAGTNTFGPKNQLITFNGAGATLMATGSLVLNAGSTVLTTTGIFDTQGYFIDQTDAFSGSGGLVKNGSGTLSIGYSGAAGQVVGGLTINNGTVMVKNRADNFGPGNVTFGPSNTPTMDLNGVGATCGLLIGGTNGVVTNSSAAANTQTVTLTGTGGGAQTFAGTIQDNPNVSGSGGYVAVSVNGGTQVLSGVSTYTGWTTVSGSASGLVVTGSLSGTGNVSVQQGGTLMGTGLVGNIHVQSPGGTVAPGTPNGLGGMNEGTLSVTTLGLDTGGTNAHLAMTLGGTTVAGITPSSRVSLSGGIWVTGADLQLTLATGYTPAPGDTFFLTINGGSETGTFTTVNGLAGSYGQDQVFAFNGVNYQLSYNASFNGGIGSLFDNPGSGHDIALMVAIPEPGTWALLVGGMGMLGLWQRRRSKI